MAQLHSALPTKHYGEHQLAKQLISIPDDQLHLWFATNQIPGVRDVDLLVWHEKVGVFVIEVKAVPLDFIEMFGWRRCKIKDREEAGSPQLQANEAMYALQNFLKPHTGRIFLTSAPCFPQIRRNDWDRRWDDKRVTGTYAESMLFHDDMYSDPSAFAERLEYIRLNPLVGAKSQHVFRHNPGQLEKFVNALSVEAIPKASASDLDRLKIIETTVRNEEKRLIAPFSGLQFLYTGAPGTGKTFRLLKVAHEHAMKGCKVLFACFNKVLAADIKRLLKFSDKLPLIEGELEVHDVWEIINLYIGKPPEGDVDLDEWASLVVEQMKEGHEKLPRFDTILIDEAQDLKGWAFEMLSLYSHERSTICVATGRSQELYGTSAEFLTDFSLRAKKRPLRRNFRNTEAIARYAMACYEANWDTTKVGAAVSKFPSKSTAEGLGFDRPGGELPSLKAVDETSLEGLRREEYPEAQNDLMIAEYRRIIRGELENLDANHRPTDLLILVPAPNAFEQKWAVEALMVEGIAFLNYTQWENRRCIAPADQVRLCTFHSARGIEGQRVIVFGIEQILTIAKNVNAEPRNLGYIVLSRPVLDMVIAYRPTNTSPVMTFLFAVLKTIRLKQNAGGA